jgi:hypothetical protein
VSHIVINLSDQELHDIVAKATEYGYKKAKEETTQHESEWVEKEEACKLLNISEKTLPNYRTERRIEFRGTRNNIKYSRKSIETYLESKRIKAI